MDQKTPNKTKNLSNHSQWCHPAAGSLHIPGKYKKSHYTSIIRIHKKICATTTGRFML